MRITPIHEGGYHQRRLLEGDDESRIMNTTFIRANNAETGDTPVIFAILTAIKIMLMAEKMCLAAGFTVQIWTEPMSREASKKP